MSGRADFTDEEWQCLERSPIVAGMAITLADPGGPIEAVKESVAVLKTITEAAQSGGHGDLVGEVAKSVTEKAQKRQSPLGGFQAEGALAGQEIVEELQAVNAILAEKASPDEAGFREWLLSAAKRSAEAAKEGGFMGFKAERVSEGEQKMLDKLGEVLS